jgi:hypothetical protein
MRVSGRFSGQVPACTADYLTPFSFTDNPATLAQLAGSSMGLKATRPFMLEELQTIAFAAVLKTNPGNFGISHLRRAGPYHESITELGYGRKLATNADAGINFLFADERVRGYNKRATIGVEAGIVLHLSNSLRFAAGFHNSLFTSRKSREQPNSLYTAGIDYTSGQKFHLSIVCLQYDPDAFEIYSAIEYRIANVCNLSAGFSTLTKTSWLAARYNLKKLFLQATFNFHPVLGQTPALSFFYNLKANRSVDE